MAQLGNMAWFASWRVLNICVDAFVFQPWYSKLHVHVLDGNTPV